MSNTSTYAQGKSARTAARAVFMHAVAALEDRHRLPDDVVTREVLEPDMVTTAELIVVSRLSGPSRPGWSLAVHLLALDDCRMILGPYRRPWWPQPGDEQVERHGNPSV